MCVRRLRSEIYSQPPSRLIEIGHAATRLKRRGVATLKECMYVGLYWSFLKSFVSSLLVADFPMKNVIALLLAVIAKYGRIGIKCLVRIHQHWQLLIFH